MKRLLLSAFAALALVPSSFAIVDSNDNGISDLWEKDHNNGELFSETFDPQADPDADGWTNAQEAAAGTNPFDPSPPDGIIRPDIIHSPVVMDEDEWGPYVVIPEAVTVSWSTLPGKQYTLLFSADLSEESWIPVGNSFVGNGNVVEYGFQTGDSDKRFWRVAVSDADTDGDGLTDIEESSLGSSIYLADTDGDGIDDSAAYASGMDPSGDGSDSDGDGIPDNELYSVVFEVQQESHSMPSGVGFEAFGNPDNLHRYLTHKDSEKYTVSGSPNYSSVTDGEHVWTSTHLVNGSIPADGQPVSSEQGVMFSSWKSSHGTTLGEGESLHTGTTVTTVDGPTLTATQIKTVTTDTTPWTVKNGGNVVRSGTEIITTTEQYDLSNEVTYQDLWNNQVKPRPWDDSPPLVFGPLEWMDYNRATAGDAKAAEYIRDHFLNSDFGIFGNVSSPGTAYSDYGSDDRLKSLRWRWVKFNPQSPFGYEYATPPAAVRQNFHLLVTQRDYLDTREWSGNDPLVDETTTKGIVEIECTASEGTTDWQTVPLTKFDSYKLEDPVELTNIDFSKRAYSQVWLNNFPVAVRGYVTRNAPENVGTVNGIYVKEDDRRLIPSTDDYTGFKTIPKSELKIAQWDRLFESIGGWHFDHDKFKNDVDAFRIRLPDIPPPTGTAEHRVKIWTEDAAGAVVDPGAEADLNVFAGFHETAAFCLVQDEDPADYTNRETDDSFAVEGKQDGALGDRTYRAQLGGKLKYQWLTAPGEGPKPVFEIPIPIKKTVTLQGYILKTALGNPAVDLADANVYFERARKIMSAVGVKLDYSVAVVAANPAGVRFGGGIGGDFNVPFSPDNKVIQASPEVRALMDAPGFRPSADVIPVYFASSFNEANFAGITTVASVMDPADAAYANAIFLNGDKLSESTLAHELLHVVLDATHDGDSPLWFQDHNNKVPWCLWSYKLSQPVVENGILARRRILDTMRSRLLKSPFCK